MPVSEEREEQARQLRFIFEQDRALAGSLPIEVKREVQKAKDDDMRKLERGKRGGC